MTQSEGGFHLERAQLGSMSSGQVGIYELAPDLYLLDG